MKSRTLICSVTSIIILFVASSATSHDWDPIENTDFLTGVPPEYQDAGAVVVFDRGYAKWREGDLKFSRYTRLSVTDGAAADEAGALTFQIADYDHLHKFHGRLVKRDGTVLEIDKGDISKEEICKLIVFTAEFAETETGDIIDWYYEIDYYGGYDHLGAQKLLYFVQTLGGISPSQRRKLEAREASDVDNYLEREIRNLPTWHFDGEYYTLSSTLTVELFSQLQYGYYASNFPEGEESPETEEAFWGAKKTYTWSLMDIAPYKPGGTESRSSSDRTAIYFNQVSTGYSTDVLEAGYDNDYWANVGTELHGYLTAYCERTRKLKKKANSLVEGIANPREKIEAIFRYVSTEYQQPKLLIALRPMNWNVGNLYSDKIGSGFEINVLLMEMLRAVGVSASPVLVNIGGAVSFRNTGRFDHLVVLCDLDGLPLFLDACARECSPGHLPRFSGADEGLLISEDGLSFCKIGADVCTEPVSYLESLVP